MSEIQIPVDLLYTKEHEWLRVEGNRARVGITDFAQHELGDIVFVELPAAGRKVKAGEAVAVVESVKSVSDVYAPAAGAVVARHDGLDPAAVNRDPYGEGWLYELEVETRGELLTAEQYRAHIGR